MIIILLCIIAAALIFGGAVVKRAIGCSLVFLGGTILAVLAITELGINFDALFWGGIGIVVVLALIGAGAKR